MGKQKDFLIDWLEDIGYELGYDLQNYHEVDKLTVIEYLRDAYILKDSNKEQEIIKMDKSEENNALIKHLSDFTEHETKKQLEEKK